MINNKISFYLTDYINLKYPKEFVSSRLTLGDGGINDIAGRAIVIHAGVDDLGLGGDNESKKTGNAGSRLVCGLIQQQN